MYGNVNHMTSDETQQAQDVVLGMFLTRSHPAIILFDSGASHSFITSSFVAKHNLPIANIKHTMLVTSPGGEMRTKFICPVVSISTKGVDFSSNLILLDSMGIGIILGMDWCHAPVSRNETEASVRVSRMFNSHVQRTI
jgi:hypothetical protein